MDPFDPDPQLTFPVFSIKYPQVQETGMTLSDPMDFSLPGSSVHGIFQARVLEWGAIAFSNTSIIVMMMYIRQL